jgi:hypothetical protein
MAIKTTKRKVKRAAPTIRRGAKLQEPSWEGSVGWSGEEFHKARRRATDFYYQEYKPNDLIPYLWDWMKKNGYNAKDIKLAKAAPNHSVPTVTCSLARCLTNGMPNIHPAWNAYWESLPGTQGTPGPVTDWIKESVSKLIEVGKKSVQPEEEDEKPKPSKETIYDRMRDRFSEVLGEIEGGVDDYFSGKGEFDVYKFLNTAELPAQWSGKIPEFYQPRIDELNELLSVLAMPAKERDDLQEQLIEGYSFLKGKRDINAAIKMYQAIIDGAIAHKNAKIAQRAKPQRKPPTPEKIVRKLKYMREFADLGLKSIDPREILGCTELWVYNTKTRKLGRYMATMHGDAVVAPLGVKGSAITGFDETKSVQKNLRKPPEVINKFKTIGKPQLRKLMDTIKAVDIKLSGRINADTILLRAIK